MLEDGYDGLRAYRQSKLAQVMFTIKSVCADTKGNPEGTRSHVGITTSLLDGPFGRDIADNGWADRPTVERLKESIREWGEHPDAFFANVHVEVIGWKPG